MVRSEVIRAFVIVNPAAGRAEGGDVRRVLEPHFDSCPGTSSFYETTGAEDLAAVVTTALERAYDLVVAIGGDGTISGIAGALIHTSIPLGIIPAGTGNGLAHALGIPLDPAKAVALLTDQHKTVSIDVMEVDGRIVLLNVGVGITSAAVSQTNREVKQRLGRSAYLWGTLKQLMGFQPQRYVLTVDGRRYRLRASEVLVTNGLSVYTPPLDWGPAERFRDGQLDVYVVRAQALSDYVILAGNMLLRRPKSNRHLRSLSVRESIEIDTKRPLPVQADGDIVGQTPVQVQLLPAALRVIVPSA